MAETSVLSARACRCCATAKARCSFNSSALQSIGSKCERCSRLNKECVRLETTRKRRQPKMTRTAQLERKLDGIVSLLNAAQQSQNLPLRESAGISQSAQYSTPSTQDTPDTSPESSGPSDEEAGQYLNSFRLDFMQNFPFVLVDQGTTVQNMREQRPVVLLAILTICCRSNVDLQLSRSLEFRKLVSESIYVRGERNLDLLQGIMLFCAWYHYYSGLQSIVPSLIGLVNSLITDLGYNRPVHAAHYKSFMDEIKAVNKFCAIADKPLDSEGRRSILGAFYLSSNVTFSFAKGDVPIFSPLMQECIDALTALNEFESDRRLIYMVQTQRIIGRISQSGVWDFMSEPESSRAPCSLYIKSFQKELQEIVAATSDPVRNNDWMRVHRLAVEVHLYELCFFLPSNAFNDSFGGMSRLDTLFACYTAAKTMIDIFWSIDSSSYYYITLASYCQLGTAFQALARLAFADADGWDAVQIRRNMRFIELVDEAVKRCELLIDRDDPSFEKGGWYKTSQKMKWYRQWYISKLPDTELANPPVPDIPRLTHITPQAPVEFFMNDIIWQDLSMEWGSWQA